MCTRRFRRRRLSAWLSIALLMIGATAGPGGDRIAYAQSGQTLNEINDGQFILRASPANIEAIAARHGLTVISRAGQSDVFLVSRPPGSPSSFSVTSMSSLDAVTSSIQADPEVGNFEVNA